MQDAEAEQADAVHKWGLTPIFLSQTSSMTGRLPQAWAYLRRVAREVTLSLKLKWYHACNHEPPPSNCCRYQRPGSGLALKAGGIVPFAESIEGAAV